MVGARAEKTDLLLNHRINGKYRVTRLIAKGAYGVVYRAVLEPHNREVAIKAIFPSAEQLERDPSHVSRFLREAETVSALKHANTVGIYEYGEETLPGGIRCLYMVMELVEGVTLSEVVKRGPVPPGLAIHIALQVARSLREAHEHGIVHRDIKPSNIMVVQHDKDEPEVRVVDFGIAKLLSSHSDGREDLTRIDDIIGTPGYMAPEQIRGQPITPATDTYSLGAVLYKMLAGVGPFKGSNSHETMSKQLSDDPPPLEGVAPALEELVMRCLDKRADRRFRDGRELVEALNLLRGEAPTTMTLRAQPRSRRRLWLAGLLVAVSVLLAVVGGLAASLWTFLPDRAEEVAPAVARPPPPEIPAKAEPTKVQLTTVPSGAEIWEGGRLIGQAPLELEVSPDANRALTLKSRDHEPLEVSIGADSPRQAFTLRPIPRSPIPNPAPTAKVPKHQLLHEER